MDGYVPNNSNVAEYTESLLAKIRDSDESLVGLSFHDSTATNNRLLNYIEENREMALRCAATNTAITRAAVDVIDYGERRAIISSILGALQCLRKLQIYVELPSSYEWMNLLTSLPQIRTLELIIYENLQPPDGFQGGLTGHPSLEKLVLVSRSTHHFDIPFVNILPTIPNLRSIQIEDDDAPEIHQFQELGNIRGIFNSTTVEEINIESFRLNGHHNLAIAKAFARRPNLVDFRVTNCQTVVRNLDRLFRRLSDVPRLEAFGYTCPNDIAFYSHLASYLGVAANLQKLFLSATVKNPILQGAGLWMILRTPTMRDSIQHLSLSNYSWDDGSDESIHSSIGGMGALRSLNAECKVHVVCFDIDGNVVESGYERDEDEDEDELFDPVNHERAWKNSWPSVLRSSTIQELKFQGDISRDSFLQGLKGIKKHSSLEKLIMSFHCDNECTADILVQSIQSLRGNSKIKVLEVESYSGTPGLTVQQAEVVLEALKANYTLYQCPFGVQCDEAEDDDNGVDLAIQHILKLNRCGRKYLISKEILDKKRAGVTLLEKVSDDLDCVFYHLRWENPELCVREEQQE